MTDWDRLSEEERDDLAAEFPPEQLYDDGERIPTTAQMEQDRAMRERAEKDVLGEMDTQRALASGVSKTMHLPGGTN